MRVFDMMTRVSIHALVRVRHYSTVIAKVDRTVSIHALVRVRPFPTLSRTFCTKVSIHALVRVRRGNYVIVKRNFSSFNPRTRESATPAFPPYSGPYEVSIHALVRVRRPGRLWLEYQQRNGCFAPTSHGGTHIPGRKKEMIVVKIRTPTDYVNRRCPGNFL